MVQRSSSAREMSCHGRDGRCRIFAGYPHPTSSSIFELGENDENEPWWKNMWNICDQTFFHQGSFSSTCRFEAKKEVECFSFCIFHASSQNLSSFLKEFQGHDSLRARCHALRECIEQWRYMEMRLRWTCRSCNEST